MDAMARTSPPPCFALPAADEHLHCNPITDFQPPVGCAISLSMGNTNLTHAKVMIVDDEPSIVKIVEKHLRGTGYEQIIATNDSSQALAVIHQEQPDLLLLDIMMPQVTGLELLRLIRAESVLRHLPVIILTAHVDPKTKREALEAGATDFLGKPLDAHELVLRVRNVLAVKAHQDYLVDLATKLEAEVQRQAEELIKTRHEADLRYLSGRAEIATDVLHNVGNTLNSVGTCVSLVGYMVRESKLPSLQRATDLLHQERDSLAAFLTKDERGRVLPTYLAELTDHLMQERKKILGEMELLTKHLDHIKSVVATQQKYAALGHVVDSVRLADLLGEVDELLGGSYARHGVEIVRNFEEIPAVKTDRQKLLQIVLNLVKNAVDSIKQAHEKDTGRLVMRVGQRDRKYAVIEIRDNGVGIDPANLVKIFSHGFTTKQYGHGFGLHSCANIIKELGGSIRARSEGLGKGATFSLEIPFQSEA